MRSLLSLSHSQGIRNYHHAQFQRGKGSFAGSGDLPKVKNAKQNLNPDWLHLSAVCVLSPPFRAAVVFHSPANLPASSKLPERSQVQQDRVTQLGDNK